MTHEAFRAQAIPQMTGTGGLQRVPRAFVERFKIPLPPLEVQREIVAEIEGYQRVIDGARAVIDNYRPHIPIDPEWDMSIIGEVCNLVRGSSPRPKGDPAFYDGPVPRLMVADITRDGMLVTPKIDSLTELGATKSRPMKKGEVVMAVSGNPGLSAILAKECCIHDGFVGFRDLSKELHPSFFYHWLMAQHEKNSIQSVGAVFKNLTTNQVKAFQVPMPTLEVQSKIVSQIESEQAIVDGNLDLIVRFEKKIDAAIARIWGEAKADGEAAA